VRVLSSQSDDVTDSLSSYFWTPLDSVNDTLRFGKAPRRNGRPRPAETKQHTIGDNKPGGPKSDLKDPRVTNEMGGFCA
jgi:hypothetical protein